jgi:hypothetical protein
MKEEGMAEQAPKKATGQKKDTITVRTSQRPDLDLEVSEAEHLDLEAMGLLVKSEKEGARLRQEKEKKNDAR